MPIHNRIMAQHLSTDLKSKFDFELLAARFKASFNKKPLGQIALETPDVLQALGLLLANGLPVGVALSWLAPRLQGELGTEFKILVSNLELGADLADEIRDMAERLADPGVTELSEKLVSAIERGAPISNQILQLAQSQRQVLARNLLRKAGANETKMLIPTIFLILPVTVLFAVFPSVLVLQNQI
jgi:tight adherence protein C